MREVYLANKERFTEMKAKSLQDKTPYPSGVLNLVKIWQLWLAM